MRKTHGYSLTADQKEKISKLLKIEQKHQGPIFTDLEERMNSDAALEFHSEGKISHEKVMSRRARNLDSASTAFTKLANSLKKMDPIISSRIDDQFSLFLFEQNKSKRRATFSHGARPVFSIQEIILKMSHWAKVAEKEVKNGNYYFQFYNEMTDFLSWVVHRKQISAGKLNTATFLKLIGILTGDTEKAVRKQFDRWRTDTQK